MDFNILGLVLNVIGSILLFVFGTPFHWDTENHLLWNSPSKAQTQTKIVANIFSSIGMLLVIIGFALQLYSLNKCN